MSTIKYHNAKKMIFWTSYHGHAKTQIIREVVGSFTEDIVHTSGVKLDRKASQGRFLAPYAPHLDVPSKCWKLDPAG
jgi:hypothetical protein